MKNKRWYRCRVTHGHGSRVIKTWASDPDTAVKIICKFEGCPETAVKVLNQKENGIQAEQNV